MEKATFTRAQHALACDLRDELTDLSERDGLPLGFAVNCLKTTGGGAQVIVFVGKSFDEVTGCWRKEYEESVATINFGFGESSDIVTILTRYEQFTVNLSDTADAVDLLNFLYLTYLAFGSGCL